MNINRIKLFHHQRYLVSYICFTFVTNKYAINMKTSITSLLMIFCLSILTYAQTPQDRATELKNQAQSSLNQKDYIKARYLFKKAYEAFAARENYPQAIECGVHVSMLYMSEKTFTKKVSNFVVTWINLYGPENKIRRKSFMTSASS